MSTMSLVREGGVHQLKLTNGERGNVLNLDVLQEYIDAFDEVERFEGATALVISADDPKTWSTGIDLPWLMSQNETVLAQFTKRMDYVMYRLATLNAPTVACVNGNAYAGGAVLFAACDFRVMREDRGRICFPEIDVKIPFTPMMYDLLDTVPNQQLIKHMVLLGKKLGGREAFEEGIVDAIYPADQLQQEALLLAEQLAAKDRVCYTAIKLGLKRKLKELNCEYQ